MDTSGKGGTIKHVFAGVNPQGCDVTGFKKPTSSEAASGFLWRVRRSLPAKGVIGVFDRSHYEDVLIARVHGPVPAGGWELRYRQIVDFEREVAASGTVIVKCFLNISLDEQRSRLLARLDDPTKHWKFDEGDLAERKHWDAYMDAYRTAVERCDHDAAPWYVIPSDRKWYRNWAVARIMAETVEEMAPAWPAPLADVGRLKGLLAAGTPSKPEGQRQKAR
jgi:PPK2 family polyphosphate:nucleotide phosphotransferase